MPLQSIRDVLRIVITEMGNMKGVDRGARGNVILKGNGEKCGGGEERGVYHDAAN